MIEIKRNSAELTDKKTIEKEIIQEDIKDIAQQFNIYEDSVIQILEHELNQETLGILKCLYSYRTDEGKTLLDLYINEFNEELKNWSSL